MADEVRVTQEVLEVIATNPLGNVRATQETLEVLGQGASSARFARVTQETLEVIAGVPPPQMRVTQDVLEVLVRYRTIGERAWGQVI